MNIALLDLNSAHKGLATTRMKGTTVATDERDFHRILKTFRIDQKFPVQSFGQPDSCATCDLHVGKGVQGRRRMRVGRNA